MISSVTRLLDEARRLVPTMSADELARLVAGGEPIEIVDVRERDEFRRGHIAGARSIPRGTLELVCDEQLRDRGARVVVVCAAGARSLLAARTLIELGYADASSLDQGIEGWRARGFALDGASDEGDVGGLTEAQRERYARQIKLPEVGERGQARLLGARVLLVGAGGLGCPAALYLAAAGVGTLGVIDGDAVELSNLHRQIAHATARVGARKVDSVEQSVRALNPDVRVERFDERLTGENVDRIAASFDVIIDGSDNFATRYLVSDAGVRLRKPVVHGSVSRFDGQITTFVPGAGPCYRCLFAAPPAPGLAPPCGEAGVLGVVPGLVGLMQATEALKLLLERGTTLSGRVIVYDALGARFRELRLPRDPRCAACGEGTPR